MDLQPTQYLTHSGIAFASAFIRVVLGVLITGLRTTDSGTVTIELETTHRPSKLAIMDVGRNRSVGSTGEQMERGQESNGRYTHGISSFQLNTVNIKHNFSIDDIVLPGAKSAERSGPPSPREGTTLNFGEIDKDLYRSSFPGPCNIEHLKSLNLKTIVTLVTTPFGSAIESWIASTKIQHYRINVPAHKRSEDRIPMETIAQVMKLLLDETKRPLLLHCNKGKHRTGCMSACYRKIQGSKVKDWQIVTALREYHEHADPKARAYDEAFISNVKSNIVLEAIDSLGQLANPIDYSSAIANGPAAATLNESEVPFVALPAPQWPLSPPFSTPSPLNVRQLAKALASLDTGRDRVALTPPETPAETNTDASSPAED